MAATTLLLMMDFRIYEIEIDRLYVVPAAKSVCGGGAAKTFRRCSRRARRTHMQPHNRKKLDDRVIRAAEAALAAQKYVTPVDVLVGIGWLDPGALKRWRQGQVEYLEGVVQTNLPRISEAMK